MKKAFLLLCTLLLVLGCALPLAAYHLTRAVLGACRFHGPPSAFVTGEHCFRPGNLRCLRR